MSRLDQGKFWAAVVGPAAIGVVIYGEVLGLWAARDELRHLIHLRSMEEIADWIGVGPWVRPLEMAVNAANVWLLGPEDTALSHLVSLAIFGICVGLVAYISRAVTNGNNGVAVAAGLLFLAHPANVASVYRIDTVSQQLATMFALFVFVWVARKPVKAEFMSLGTLGVLVALVLLSKETAIGLALVAPIAAATSGIWREPADIRGREVRRVAAATIGVVAVYVVLRWAYFAYGVPDVSARYGVEFSLLNILRNAVLYFGGVFFMGNTLDVFVQISPWRLAVAGVLTVLLLGIMTGGMWRLWSCDDRHAARRATCVAVVLVSGSIPAILIGKVNELYTYGSTGFFAILAVLLGYKWLQYSDGRVLGSKFGKVVGVIGVVGLAGWLIGGVKGKLDYAHAASDEAVRLVSMVDRWAQRDYEGPLCIRSVGESNSDSYNMFVNPDELMVRDAVGYVEEHRGVEMEVRTGGDLQTCWYRVRRG